MALIGISGKIGSGKDTVGKIIQYLVWNTVKSSNDSFESYCNRDNNPVFHKHHIYDVNNFTIKRFAGKVKEICSILTGIPVEDFEKQEVKDSILGEEWNKVKEYMFCGCDVVMDYSHKDGKCSNCGKPTFKETITLTVRQLLQQVGTDAMRNVIHPNVWVNALFAEYKPIVQILDDDIFADHEKNRPLPNWIITDVRFPNEAEAIKSRGGLLIRVNRNWKVQRRKELEESLPDCIYMIDDGSTKERRMVVHTGKGGKIEYELALEEEIRKRIGEHPSETSLDNYQFDEVIDNNGSLEELVKKVKLILVKHKIL